MAHPVPPGSAPFCQHRCLFPHRPTIAILPIGKARDFAQHLADQRVNLKGATFWLARSGGVRPEPPAKSGFRSCGCRSRRRAGAGGGAQPLRREYGTRLRHPPTGCCRTKWTTGYLLRSAAMLSSPSIISSCGGPAGKNEVRRCDRRGAALGVYPVLDAFAAARRRAKVAPCGRDCRAPNKPF
jgi:hypothetical protein